MQTKRCPVCRTVFSASPFECECGVKYINGAWLNIHDLKSVLRMSQDNFQGMLLSYIKNLPDNILEEIGVEVDIKKYYGYRRMKTKKGHNLLIFKASRPGETRYLAWNLQKNIVYRLIENKKGSVAYAGNKEFHDVQKWMKHLLEEGDK